MIFTINSPKYGIKEVQIDDEDKSLVSQYSWWVNRSPYTGKFYVCTEVGNRKNRRSIKLHRLIMNCDNDMMVDHRNGEPLDNRKENLRVCSQKENNRNGKKPRNGLTSKYKGVIYRKDSCKFTAQIRYNDKLLHLGYFESERDAAIAYNDAAQELHKEFAKLNILEEDCD